MPTRVDGLPLTSKQRERLASLIRDIAAVSQGRDHDGNVSHALQSFRMTVRRERGRWVDVTSFRLNGGKGVVVVPYWARMGS